jgi:hypothetical protein
MQGQARFVDPTRSKFRAEPNKAGELITPPPSSLPSVRIRIVPGCRFHHPRIFDSDTILAWLHAPLDHDLRRGRRRVRIRLRCSAIWAAR